MAIASNSLRMSTLISRKTFNPIHLFKIIGKNCKVNFHYILNIFSSHVSVKKYDRAFLANWLDEEVWRHLSTNTAPRTD